MPKQQAPMILPMLRTLVATRRRIAGVVVALLLLGLYGARDELLLRVLRSQLKKVPGAEVTLLGSHLHAALNGVTLEGVQVFRPGDTGRRGPGGRLLRLAKVNQLEVLWPWRGLLRGALVCEAHVSGVDVAMWRIPKDVAKKGGKGGTQVQPEMAPPPPEPENIVAAWPEIARFVLPMAIGEVTVHDATFWLRDCTTDPEVKWPVEGIELTAKNLTNREHLTNGHYATIDASARPAGGTWKMHMELDPMAHAPTFGLRSSVDKVQLLKVNPVLRAYAKLDVESGTFNTQLEVVSEKGRFRGFVEPHIVGLKIRPRAQDEEKDSLLNRLWRTSVRVVTSLVENSKEEAIATRLPLSGEFVSPEIGVWDAVVTLFGNAYLEALRPPVTASDALPLLKPKADPEAAARSVAQPDKAASAAAPPAKKAAAKSPKSGGHASKKPGKK